MTNTTTALGPTELQTGFQQVLTVAITSLGAAGFEAWDPSSESGLRAADDTVQILGQTDADYAITWNHEELRFDVRDVADGVETLAETDVGVVKVRVTGIR